MPTIVLPVLLAVAVPTPDPAGLVRRLGAPDYADREAAGKALRRLGWAAEPAVRAGARSADPEVARRSAVILRHLRADRWAAVEAGTADWSGPAWEHFRGIAGDTPAARKLFALAGGDGRYEGLDRAATDPAAAAELYAAGVARLTDRRPRDNPALPPFQPPSDLLHRPVPAGPAAAVLLLGTFPVPADAPEPPDVSELLEAGLHHLAAGPDPEPVRKLYAVWLARRRTAAADRPDRVLSVWSVGSSCPCC